MLSLVSLATGDIPVAPPVWTASVAQNTQGTVPGTPTGDSAYVLSYDYTNKRSKFVYSAPAKKAGEQIVYRFDQTVPGEGWSRAYKWKVGQEALCCYINQCTSDPCQQGQGKHMTEIGVEKRSTDVCPVTGGEHWHKEIDIKQTSSVQDWVVAPTTNELVSWTQNVTIRGMWILEDSKYSDIVLGNLTEADFAYPKFCNEHMCNP